MLLDGATPDEAGRHSFIAVEPFQVLESRGGRTTVDGRPRAGDPFQALRAELDRFPSRAEPDLPPFQGGAVGILGYELGGHLERLPPPRACDMGLPDMAMLFCDVVVAIDHRERRAFVLSSGHPETGARARAERARARLEAVAGWNKATMRPGGACWLLRSVAYCSISWVEECLCCRRQFALIRRAQKTAYSFAQSGYRSLLLGYLPVRAHSPIDYASIGGALAIRTGLAGRYNY